MNQLTLYNKIIYCQFCKKYYYQNIFKQHLQFCTTYLQYINKYQKDIHKLTYNTNDINISYNSDPNLFLSLVKNKRVIIVGPSITVQECNLGNFINNFDIIVRLNKSLPVPIKMYQHVGCRTDILYNSLNTSDYPGENNISPLFLKQQKIKYLRCPYPPITPFKEDIKSFYKKNINIINFGHIDTNYYKKLEYGLGTRPYTGTCAIADLLHCQVKELFVMGIDFYTYKHSFYYRNVSSVKLKKLQNNNIHQRKPQIDLIRRFYLLDNRLVVDNILDEILLENYDSLLHGIKSNIDFEKIFLTGEGKYKTSKEAIDIFLNTKVCIVGELNCDDIQKNKYKDIGLIIDLLPNRNNPIREESVKIVYRNTSNFDEYHNDKDVLFTQVYKNNIEEKFKKNNFMFINPLFTQYLKTILTKTIFSKGTLSFELFIILIFSTFFENTFISNIDPNCNWLNQSSHEKQHYIDQRMLFQYLIKRKKINYI
jgi:hypothetical protein